MNKKGFTLIELLIAVCIFSVISAGLAGVLFSGINLWNRTWKVGFVQSDILPEFEVLSRRLRQVLVTQDMPFEGNPVEMRFLSLDNNNIREFIYAFDAAEGKVYYKDIAYEDMLAAEDMEEFAAKEIFQADELVFGYLLSDGKGGYAWADEIKKKEPPPAAVRVTVVRDSEVFEKFISLPAYTP